MPQNLTEKLVEIKNNGHTEKNLSNHLSKHLTVESYMVIYASNSYTYYY